MQQPAPDWDGYLGGIASFAGTLFALVLAARQIRGHLEENPDPKVSWARLVDSIAVTVELGAAASLALLYSVRSSELFTYAAGWVVLWGLGLSIAAAAAYIRAIRAGHFRDGRWDRHLAILQAAGNVLPAACYFVVGLYALEIVGIDGRQAWGYVAAVSWLTFSGTVQSILWYGSMWERTKGSSGAPQSR